MNTWGASGQWKWMLHLRYALTEMISLPLRSWNERMENRFQNIYHESHPIINANISVTFKWKQICLLTSVYLYNRNSVKKKMLFFFFFFFWFFFFFYNFALYNQTRHGREVCWKLQKQNQGIGRNCVVPKSVNTVYMVNCDVSCAYTFCLLWIMEQTIKVNRHAIFCVA